MIKRFGFIVLAIVGIALQSWGQKVDLNNVKFITVITDHVNMRKLPSTNSAKLMMESLDGAEGCDSRAYPVWSNSKKQPGYSRYTVSPTNYDAYPVIGETADWYKILYWDFVEGSFEVWIAKQYCRILPLYNWNARGSYTMIKNKPYAGWVVMDNSDSENGEEYLMGCIINQMMVFSKSCSDRCCDLMNCDMENLTTRQIDEFFKPREKKLVMFNAGGRSGCFEMD